MFIKGTVESPGNRIRCDRPGCYKEFAGIGNVEHLRQEAKQRWGWQKHHYMGDRCPDHFIAPIRVFRGTRL